MTRSLGSRDKKKRKSRRDKKKKYTKHGNKFIPYVPKRDKNDLIKIWVWQRIPMSIEGVKHFPKQVRPYVNRVVTKFGVRADVPPERLSNVEEIKNLAIEIIGYEGNFLIMGFSRGKNRFHVKPVKLCRVIITESPEGLHASVSETLRLSRYFFWKGK